MLEVLVTLISLAIAPRHADAVRSTSPAHLTSATARDHLATAIAIGMVTHTRMAVLLAIGDHEGNYQFDAVTPEPPLDGWKACAGRPQVGRCAPRWSCGVMTPEPVTDRAVCDRMRSSLAAGYLAGALHLRGWLETCRGNETCALMGYAGAWTIRDQCVGPMVDQPRQCRAAWWFVTRARTIERALTVANRDLAAM